MTDDARQPENAARPFAGRRAVVTGSSSGIGRAIAIELARAGADIVVHAARNRDGAEETAAAIRGLDRRAVIRMCDLADERALPRLVDESWNAFGDVDIWVNNAGADVLTGEARDWPFGRKLERLWQVDVLASIHLSREVGRRMKETAALGIQTSPDAPGSRLDSGSNSDVASKVGESARAGHGTTRFVPAILNMGWDQAEIGMAGDSGEMFAAIKGAVMAFTRSLAASLAPHVRVNCLAPGWIRTSWGEEASDYWQQRARGESLLERWGRPEDVARAACFLVSPAAAFITGHVLPINGGLRRGAVIPHDVNSGDRP